jgi:hypothetical protein
MCRVNRLKYAAAIAGGAIFALAPVTAGATPTPNPSLDMVLAAPPGSDYSDLTTSPLHGKFSAHDWASLSGTGSAATETEATLNQDGFVDGYGKTWRQQSSSHTLIEAVMAFSGGRGAGSALTAMEASDKADANFKHSNTISGLGTYYGAHFYFVDPTTGTATVEDFFGFVKGNDVFGIAFVSGKDDVLAAATSQAKSQYDSAPNTTIPSSDWPENAASASSLPAGAIAIAVGFVVIVVALVAFFLIRRRGPTPMPVGAYVMPAAQGAVGAPAPVGAVQMSPDGNYWWDGQAWRDAAQEAPPMAQRSSDGTLWWDGQKWRPVGQAPPEQPPTWPSS